MVEISDAAGVTCSRCGELYELANYCQGPTHGDLPWLVILEPATSIREALSHAVCQVCHGFKPGPSLKECIQQMGAKTTAAPRLLTRQEVLARITDRRASRLNIAPRQGANVIRQPVVSSVPPSGGRMAIAPGAGLPTRTSVPAMGAAPTRQSIDPRPNMSTRQSVGAHPHASGRQQILAHSPPPIRPQVAPPQRVATPPMPPRRERQAPRDAGANLGAQVLMDLNRAIETGNELERDRLLQLAIAANLPHPLVTEAVNAQIERDRQAREAAREVERQASQEREAARLKVFKTALAQAKGYLTRSRHAVQSGEDATSLVDFLERQVEKMLAHANNLSREEALNLVGTTHRELEQLALSFYLDLRAVPGPSISCRGITVGALNEDQTIGSMVTRIGVSSQGGLRQGEIEVNDRLVPVVTRCGAMPRANSRIREVTGVCSIVEPRPKIGYPEGELYGNQPFLIFPDGRHVFQAAVQLDGELESFMGQGQWAAMEFDRGACVPCSVEACSSCADGTCRNRTIVQSIGWGYTPCSEDGERSLPMPRFGSFARGFIPRSRIPVEHITVVVVDVVSADEIGRSHIEHLCFGATLMAAGNVQVQPVGFAEDLLLGAVHHLTGGTNEQVFQTLLADRTLAQTPHAIRRREKYVARHEPRVPKPTETQCVRLPPAPGDVVYRQ